jgi:hypothetical protein
MQKDIFQENKIDVHYTRTGLSKFESYSLRHFHPRSLFIDSASMIWSVYFLWENNWTLALGIALIGRIVAYLSTYDVDPEKLSQTTWGKIALLHLTPINLLTQSVGLILFIYSIWTHSTLLIMASISIILLGHLKGWDKVEEKFS